MSDKDEESRTELSKSFTVPIVISGVALVSIGTVLHVIYKKKKPAKKRASLRATAFTFC